MDELSTLLDERFGGKNLSNKKTRSFEMPPV